MQVSESILNLAKRNNTHTAIIMLDIDKFKNVNDTYGHTIGDDVIIAFAQVLQKYTRKSDTIINRADEVLYEAKEEWS